MVGCRVKSVTLKSTGQKIEIVPRKDRTEVAQDLIDNMFKALNNHPDPKAYMFVVLDGDGTYTTGCDAKDFPFGYSVFVSTVCSLLNRDINTTSEIKHFCRQQGWIK